MFSSAITSTGRPPKRLIGLVTATVLLTAVSSTHAVAADAARSAGPCLQTSQILDLFHYLASTSGAPDAYSRIVQLAFEGPHGNANRMTAYEENSSFVYALASMQSLENLAPGKPPSGQAAHWLRRMIVLNASTLIVDDEALSSISAAAGTGCLVSTTAPRLSGRTARIHDAAGEIFAEILSPEKSTYQIQRANGQGAEGYRLEMAPGASVQGARTVQILHVSTGGASSETLQSQMTSAGGQWILSVTTDRKVFKLTLPPPTEGAGEISIATSEGKTVLASRPFPSGILPHGPEGDRLLELWDSDYRHAEPALWDVGRPADELQKIVSNGRIAPCRVVDMCCGSGSDAIYLASKGFEVTAIDVAPTALAMAEKKADDAHDKVNWVLADILAPPDLKPFDFIYDRGCYHVVRDQNLTAYLETVRRFSHPGTKFLLLASRRDDLAAGEHSGVTEEELRFDFLSLFDMEWLREITLESNRRGPGPPGWSAFLKRNTAP